MVGLEVRGPDAKPPTGWQSKAALVGGSFESGFQVREHEQPTTDHALLSRPWMGQIDFDEIGSSTTMTVSKSFRSKKKEPPIRSQARQTIHWPG